VLAIPAETRLDVNINSRLFADDCVTLSDLFQKILAEPYPKTNWLRLNGLLLKSVRRRSAVRSRRRRSQRAILANHPIWSKNSAPKMSRSRS
jgi:hypothetical protein